MLMIGAPLDWEDRYNPTTSKIPSTILQRTITRMEYRIMREERIDGGVMFSSRDSFEPKSALQRLSSSKLESAS